MIRADYHIHTKFCDGADTPEEIVREAIAKGCEEIGFSGHSYTAFDPSWCMSEQGTEKYRNTVRELQKTYAGKIRILLGVEQDFYSEASTDGYDFIIGSVHYIRKEGIYLPVDESAEQLKQTAEQYYQGDFDALAEDYFELVGRVWDKTHCDIIGHFDLITKFNEQTPLFKTDSPRYRAAALGALDRLCKTPAAFEINTGAMARGYRTTPYPEPFLLEELHKRGAKLLKTSDCHRKEFLLYAFDRI